MKRLTYFDGGKWRLKIGDTEYSGDAVDHLAAYEETGLLPEEVVKMGMMLEDSRRYSGRLELKLKPYLDIGLGPSELNALKLASMGKCVVEIKEFDGIAIDRLRELAKAEKDGRLVVLPFPLHSTLFDASNEAQPELLKDFSLSATWTHCGIVFHSPWSIFLDNIERGYIKQMSEEAEAALKGENHEADLV